MKTRVIGLVLLSGSGCFHEGESVGGPGATATTGEATTGEMSTTSTTSTTTAAITGSPGESTGTSSGEPTSTSVAGTTEVNTGEPPAVCGDGVVGGDESCDLGPENDDAGPCTSACQLAQCGDGFLHVGVEECDHGNLLNHDNAACTKGCKKAKCGDGLVFWGVEECDDGPNNQAGLYGGCTPMTCTLGPHCGDKVIQAPKEECDEGDQNGADGKCLGSCVWNGSVVFVTSKAYTGALGGLAGADDKCNTLAMVAGVPNAGAFMAWIGVGDTTPASRMKHSTGRYLLRNGTVIAESWTDLTDGWLAAPIDRDEKGAPIEMENPTFAWTGANAYGTGTDPSKRCLSWSNGTKEEVGRRGAVGESDFTWSSAGDAPCWLEGRIICVEQI
ncbi:MAG TPA: hypothetical protein PKW35_10445 [Nannocystaceae bacterium]|nr:hypothetical protein [Nannocystaceae bacterium]